MTQELAKLAIATGARLGQTCATVESITGGRVAATLTGVPGASAVVKGGVVTYTDEIKHTIIGVPTSILETVGAVSQECARYMALGGKERLNVDVAVSITGFAGPAGPTDNHPVGTVYYGIATTERQLVYQALHHGDRDQIQAAATRQALLLLCAALLNQDGVAYSLPYIDYPLQQLLPTE